jgi:putative endopeptidase
MTRSIRILVLAIASISTACSAAGHAASPARSSTTSTAPPASAPALGINPSYIDHAVKPGDDFFMYANGAWYKTAVIEPQFSTAGAFLDVFKVTEEHTADLISHAGASHPASGTNARKIADYYAAYMNTAAIEKAGLAPLNRELDAIDAIASRADLARVLGSRLRADVDPINDTNFQTEHLFGLFVTKGLEEASLQIPYLLQGGLGMPSRDDYLSKETHMAQVREKYTAYVAALLKQAGIADAGQKAQVILGLETKIAQAQESLVESEDIHKANHLWTLADFPKRAPGLDWPAYFQAAGLDRVARIDVWQPSGITGEAALVGHEPIAAWKDLLVFHTLNGAASVLPKAYADLSFDFYGRTLQGTPQQRERAKRAVDSTSAALGDAVGQLYAEKYFPASSKAAAQAMVKNLIAAFRAGIRNLAWMSPATKARAEGKLDTLIVGVGYPDRWRDYSALVIKPTDPLGNRERVMAFEYEYAKAKIGKPIDPHEWWMTPQTVNAVNLPLQNALNFPAAMLQPPFFDPSADPAANYGAIGAIIGHEISHSFDNTGADFDAEGRLHNWWTPADLAHFEAATAALAKQYDGYEVLPGLHVNGKQTLGEDIADVSGLTASYRAYHLSPAGQSARAIDGLTGDQRFFIAFGQAWRSRTREAALRQELATDVHAPDRVRAEAVRNLDPWYTAFDVKAGEKLYLAPDQRMPIW